MNDTTREMILPLRLNNYPFIIKHKASWVEEIENNKRAFILMKYFGGTDLVSTDIDKYLSTALVEKIDKTSLLYLTYYFNLFKNGASNIHSIVFFIDQIIFQTI
jgi:hypothetical protein